MVTDFEASYVGEKISAAAREDSTAHGRMAPDAVHKRQAGSI